MLSNEIISLIHLNMIQGVGLKTVQLLRDVFGSAEGILQATPDELEKIDQLPPALRDLLQHKPTQYPVERELELINEYGCQVVTLYDAAYPQCLKEIDTPPLVLYIRGKLTPEDSVSLSIVGSRDAKDYGRKVSYRLSYQLAQHGLTVVSGLAKGIDTSAHRGALEAGGRTVAVMGSGLSFIYPATNRDLAEKITESGALISEFPMQVKPKPRNFPRRNRIISGLTLGTVVVEASNRSGALITARLAGEQGREVFAVPGEIFSELSTGTHKLINNGAKLINTVDDLLNELPPYALSRIQPNVSTSPMPDVETESSQESPIEKTDPRAAAAQPSPEVQQPIQSAPAPPPDLTPDERTVFDAIEIPSSHIDTIVRTTQLPISQVSSVLLMLELKGVVQQLPGKQFAKTG
ncbi:DNA-protecting protein DprA [Candidatus Poribacteria bacterium]|nr:MAG: DNA-protecting protein DprA [Candidatus Poribacteria bacterium]